MKKIVLISVLGVLASCSSHKTVSREDVVFTKVSSVESSKNEIYSGLMVYLSKNLGDSNYAIKLKDQEDGKIVSQISIKCNELAQSSTFGVLNYVASFNFEATIKERKMKLELEGISYRVSGGDTPDVVALYKQSQIKALSGCADKLFDEMLEAVKSSKTENKDF